MPSGPYYDIGGVSSVTPLLCSGEGIVVVAEKWRAPAQQARSANNKPLQAISSGKICVLFFFCVKKASASAPQLFPPGSSCKNAIKNRRRARRRPASSDAIASEAWVSLISLRNRGPKKIGQRIQQQDGKCY